MLKRLDPLLGPDLLAALRAMGHGDEVVIADANFPATALARRLLRLDGVSAPRATAAIVSVLPLDGPAAGAVARMSADAEPEAGPPAVANEMIAELRAVGFQDEVAALGRMAFYARAQGAFAIVATGEPRFWGNLILRKGALASSGRG